ncbi:hypothetical protein [Carboxylicivirga sp. RSCT41]|uniref:hypothetical protein n=1 Tax=Carboxylicivirga agarovorans TaxID=3417570 RepID=UPI003D3406F8
MNLKLVLLCLIILSACNKKETKETSQDQIKSEVEALLTKYGVDSYSWDKKGGNLNSYKQINIEELEIFLRSRHIKGASHKDSTQGITTNTIKAVASPPVDPFLQVNGKAISYYSMETININAHLEWYHNGYWGLWDINDLEMYVTGIMPSELDNIYFKLIKSDSRMLEVRSTFTIRFGIKISDLNLTAVDKLEAYLVIDTMNESMDITISDN